MGMCRSTEWIKDQIDEFFQDNSRTDLQLYNELEELIAYIKERQCELTMANYELD
jgi:uncharacterized protein YpbB